jgi:hypothetical protein
MAYVPLPIPRMGSWVGVPALIIATTLPVGVEGGGSVVTPLPMNPRITCHDLS